MWSKRVLRIIDTREKINLPMKWPRNPLSKIILESVSVGKYGPPIKAYTNDSLINYYDLEELVDRTSRTECFEIVVDPSEPDYTIDTCIQEVLSHEEIVRFKVMEDWIFNKQSGMFYPKIIAIAPLFVLKIEGQNLGEQAWFWVKYDEIRTILANEIILNTHNDAMPLSYSNFLELRLFNSYIVKENNVFDLAINEMEQFENDGLGALLQAEKINEKIFIWESDLWEY